MKKYVGTFGVSYTLITAFLAWLDYSYGFGNAGMNLVTVMGSSFLAAGIFVKDTGRAPTAEERSSYSWSALAVLFLLSFLLAAVAMAILIEPAESAEILNMLASGIALMAGGAALIIIGGIYFLVIRWAFSWYASKAAR